MSKIYHSLILLIVGIALIGINVSKLYCTQCEKVFLQVKVMPEENDCPCEHGCACCDDKTQKTDIPDSNTKSVFYKVTDFSQTERSLECVTMICFVEACLLPEPVLSLINNQFLSYQKEYPDLPPSPELLCTYRC